MNEKTVLFWVLGGSGLLAILHLTGIYGGFYHETLWFDVLPHFVGGLVVGGGLLYVLPRFPRYNRVGIFVAVALTIIIGWEVFEFAANLFREPNYALDTIVDVVLGACGAWSMRYFVLKRKDKMAAEVPAYEIS